MKFRIILVGTFDADDVDDANKRLARMFLDRINYQRDLDTLFEYDPESMFDSTVEEPTIIHLLDEKNPPDVNEIRAMVGRYLDGLCL